MAVATDEHQQRLPVTDVRAYSPRDTPEFDLGLGAPLQWDAW